MRTDRIVLKSCKVIENREMARGHFWMDISAPDLAQGARPGQFLEVHVPSPVPLLPRPMSLAGIDPDGGRVSILYRVVGSGTTALAKLGPGDRLRVMGPLGNGFPDPEGKRAVLVAGGTGIAPLLPLLKLTAPESQLLYGAAEGAQMVDVDGPAAGRVRVQLATEDGSRGHQGLVTDLLERTLPESGAGVIYACGPRPMLAQVARQAFRLGVPAWVSLEERMACGVGACLGCSVMTDAGYRRVCRDGPVFSAREVVWDHEA